MVTNSTQHLSTKAQENKDKLLIMQKFRSLRKLAISYWNIFAFTSSYCLIFPIVNKYNKSSAYLNILYSFCIAYYSFNWIARNMIKMFNNKDFESFKIYALKNQLHDEYLF